MLLNNVLLSKHTTYKIGGKAKFFAEAYSKEDIISIINEYKNISGNTEKIFILGGGSNVLFSDDGYDGLVIKISCSDIRFIENNIIRVLAGTPISHIVNFTIENNLTGLEFAAGIPGLFGGAIRGNAGAFRGEMKDVIVSIQSMDIKEPYCIKERTNIKEIFGYRTSIFKTKDINEIILSADIKLLSGEKESIKNKIETNLQYRKNKQPIEWPSAGSTFKNIDVSTITESQKKQWEHIIKIDPFPVIPVAFLISELGLKGTKIGGAQISDKHSNFFINYNSATSDDVQKLIAFTKEEIKNKFNLKIEEEIQIVK